jgi:broad specificity phosphatase PhoE
LKRIAFFIFILIGALPAFSQSRKLSVYLVRHAKVDMNQPAFIGSKKASALFEGYNTRPIQDFNPQFVRDQIKAKHPKVIASALPRALQTAGRVFPNDSIVGYSIFNEYRMGIVRVPLIHMPYPAWTGFSRLMWLMHLNSAGESRSDSKERLAAATDLLENLAEENTSLVLFAHGYLLSEMKRELRKRGWQMRHNGGNKNLAVSHLEKMLAGD